MPDASTQTQQSTTTYGEALLQIIAEEKSVDLKLGDLNTIIEGNVFNKIFLEKMVHLMNRCSEAKTGYCEAVRGLLRLDFQVSAQQSISDMDFTIFIAYICTIKTLNITLGDIVYIANYFASSLKINKKLTETLLSNNNRLNNDTEDAKKTNQSLQEKIDELKNKILIQEKKFENEASTMKSLQASSTQKDQESALLKQHIKSLELSNKALKDKMIEEKNEFNKTMECSTQKTGEKISELQSQLGESLGVFEKTKQQYHESMSALYHTRNSQELIIADFQQRFYHQERVIADFQQRFYHQEQIIHYLKQDLYKFSQPHLHMNSSQLFSGRIRATQGIQTLKSKNPKGPAKT